jgi:uncharacterized protein (TIGR00369 family)
MPEFDASYQALRRRDAAMDGVVFVAVKTTGIYCRPVCPGLAIQSTLEKGIGQTTLEFKISLLRPITPETGAITAEGKVLNCGRRIGTADGRVTDARGRLLAHGTTTCLIFPT